MSDRHTAFFNEPIAIFSRVITSRDSGSGDGVVHDDQATIQAATESEETKSNRLLAMVVVDSKPFEYIA